MVDPQTLMRLSFAIFLLAIGAVIHAAPAAAQTKFDSYGWLVTDDEAAHLDAFRVELGNHPEAHGYLVGYNGRSTPPGVFLRRLYGDKNYLVELRGLEPTRISVVEAGYREKSTIELWITPDQSIGLTVTPETISVFDKTKRFLFDEVCLECEPVVPLDLWGLDSGLRFYGTALSDAGGHALIVVRPGMNTSSRQALAAARELKQRLAVRYNIAASKIRYRLAPRGKDNMAIAQLWVIPRVTASRKKN